MAGEWGTARISDIVNVTDYIANGSFESLRNNVTYRSEPDYAVLVRLVDHNAGWGGTFVYVDKASYDFLRKSALEPGDIVIANVGANAGTVFRVPRLGTRMTLGPNAVLCRPRDANNLRREFLYYYLASDSGQESLRSILSGSAQPKFNKTDLRSLSIPVPPPSEQWAIAHILGTLDDKIELNRRMNETLEAMARALFKSWFVDFDPVRAKAEGRDPGLPKPVADLLPDSFEDLELGGIPKGWEMGVLDQLADVVLGGDWGGDEQDAERSAAVRCIRGADIPDLQIGGTGKMPVRFLKPSSLAKRRLNDGDLVVEISGGSPTQSTGRPVLVSRELLGRLHLPLVCSNFCRLLKLRSPAFSKFVYLWLRLLYANDEFLQFENGTTGIKNLAFTLFSSSFKFCVPPPDVLEAFDLRVAPLFNRQQANAADTDTLAALRDTLLPKLISGELRVKDAERLAGRRPTTLSEVPT